VHDDIPLDTFPVDGEVASLLRTC